ncbi:MAG: ATP-binding cassette domain-containing protein [Pseudomonadota bacterium]
MLVLRNINFRRGATPILTNFNLELGAGETCALLGPSGVGKSTLLALTCGILSPDSGSIHVEGEDLTALSPSARNAQRASTMGIVFQNLSLMSALSVTDNLALAGRMAGAEDTNDSQAQQLLSALGIEDVAGRKPRHLSRGQAQRAAIARALMGQPKLILADEPTASLDAAWRDKAIACILSHRDTHKSTVLITTHDPAVAQHFDRVIELQAAQAA